MKDLCGLKDSTKDLIERAHNNDKEAREKLILDNMGLIGSIVKRFELILKLFLAVACNFKSLNHNVKVVVTNSA